MAQKIIEAQNLTKVYKGKIKAVDDISFYVEQGEIFGFLGPNGAGKTTTIKMLNTLASITEGRATVDGKDVSKHHAAVREPSAPHLITHGARTAQRKCPPTRPRS